MFLFIGVYLLGDMYIVLLFVIVSVIILCDNFLWLIVMFYKGLFYYIIDCYVLYIRLYEFGNFSKCYKLLIGCFWCLVLCGNNFFCDFYRWY